MKTIDTDNEHFQILVELGVLDDLEDWILFQKQESKYFELLEEIGIEKYCSYMKI